jgi:type I restriction enzyme S subunit
LNDDEKMKYGVIEGDLLFARQSLVKEGAGKCSIVLYVPEITCFEGHLIRVRLDKNDADPLFYY